MKARLATTVVLALLLVGCGAGGFGGRNQPAPTPDPIRNYVALGDGYAAAPKIGTTDPADGCERSTTNYPAQVAKALAAKLVDRSCTGAETQSLLAGTKLPGGPTLPPQVESVVRSTDLVTISVGLADNQVGQRIFAVCLELPCGDRIPAGQLVKQVGAIGDRVGEIVRDVQTRAPSALILIVGYPRIAPEKRCAGLPPLDEKQLSGVRQLYEQANRTLRSAAQTTGATFVDVDAATSGHDVCADEPWVRRPAQGVPAKYALLPLAPAQKATADAVLAAVRTR